MAYPGVLIAGARKPRMRSAFGSVEARCRSESISTRTEFLAWCNRLGIEPNGQTLGGYAEQMFEGKKSLEKSKRRPSVKSKR